MRLRGRSLSAIGHVIRWLDSVTDRRRLFASRSSTDMDVALRAYIAEEKTPVNTRCKVAWLGRIQSTSPMYRSRSKNEWLVTFVPGFGAMNSQFPHGTGAAAPDRKSTDEKTSSMFAGLSRALCGSM